MLGTSDSDTLAALDRCESHSSFPHSNKILTLDRRFLCAGLISGVAAGHAKTDRASVLQDRAAPPTRLEGPNISSLSCAQSTARISNSRHVGSSYRRDNRYQQVYSLHRHWDYAHSSKSPTKYDGAKGAQLVSLLSQPTPLCHDVRAQHDLVDIFDAESACMNDALPGPNGGASAFSQKIL